MRKPTRKYKVPKAIMAERLEIGWLNVARVRALCIEVNGDDPEVEKFDQSPSHHNESGSQNTTTLAGPEAGGTVADRPATASVIMFCEPLSLW